MNNPQPADTNRIDQLIARFIEKYAYEMMAIISLLGLIGGILLTSRWFNRSFEPLTFVQASDATPVLSITPILLVALEPSPINDSKINGLININTASEEELMSLPGIGPVFAQRIIEARPFTSINQLLQVKGIGEKRFSDIKGKVGL